MCPTKKMGGKTKMIIGIILAILVIIAVAVVAVMMNRLNSLAAMSFSDTLEYTLKGNKNAVITVGIIKDGKAEFVVYGEDAKILPQKEYQYEIGSLTKTFTTSLLCKAISEEKASLDDKIDSYINLPPKSYYPTLRRLATHTSGYKPYYYEKQMKYNFLHKISNDFYGVDNQTLINRAGKVDLQDKTYGFTYSNFGMSVLGNAVSEIYGESYESVISDYISNELKLHNTHISDGTGDLSGYWQWNKGDAYIPAGAIVSTIGDMLKYTEIHMTEKLPYLAQAHEAIEDVNATTSQYAKMGIRMDAVGIGWIIDKENNIVWHNGGTTNFNAYLGFDKEKQIGVVILSNTPPSYKIPATVMGVKLIKELQIEKQDGELQ